MTTPEPRRWRRVDFHEEHGHTAIVAKAGALEPTSRENDARLHFTLLLFSYPAWPLGAGIRELLRKIPHL